MPNVTARLAGLYRYPLKSGRGEPLASARLADTGLEGDRRWMLVRPDGRFLTQREHPRLALLQARHAGDSLQLSAPGLEPLVAVPGEPREVLVWKDRVLARDAGDGAAGLLGGWLGTVCRLVQFDPARPRYSAAEWTGGLLAANAFSDGFPLLLVNRASLDDLSARAGAPLPVERFRPNLLVEGLPAWAEDSLQELSVGGIVLRLAKPCARCSITTVDPHTGRFDGEEPLRTLRSFRHDSRVGGFTFGINTLVVRGVGGTLAVGDELVGR
jgi:uncharacterized protein YcbX